MYMTLTVKLLSADLTMTPTGPILQEKSVKRIRSDALTHLSHMVSIKVIKHSGVTAEYNGPACKD